jgi:lactoylglutathione lyase
VAVRKIEHLGIMVKHLETSIRFYEEVIGLKKVSTLTHTEEKLELAFLSFPDTPETEIELIEGYDDSLPEEGKVHHIAFTVEDIEAEFERIKSLGLPLIDEEITTLSNGSRYFFFYGPDHEWLEFFQR